MNTLSNEELIEIISGVVDGVQPTTQEMVMARELLALRKEREAAVPVAYIIQDADARARGEKGFLRRFADISAEDIIEYEISITALYTAPPAQPVAVPVRYMNRYTGACYTLEQQPDAATDTIVYVPLYDVARPVAVPDEMYWQDAPVEGSTRAAAYATGWNACRDAMHGSTISNSADIAIDEASQSFGNSEQLEPVSQPYKLVGEVVAWDHPTKERSVDFRWLNYDVAPGTKLYAMSKE